MTPKPPDIPESAITTPKGRRFWGGHIHGNKYSYWIRFGDLPDELLHVDAKGTFNAEEIDAVTDYLLWASERDK